MNTVFPPTRNWAEFLGHFERREVSIGTCARAFATPCVHEHACVRCSMLWPDPNRRDRSTSATTSSTASPRPKREGWLGEVEGLRVSLAGAETKLAQIDHRTPQATPVTLGPTRTKAQQK
jgi:hypothetical protein